MLKLIFYIFFLCLFCCCKTDNNVSLSPEGSSQHPTSEKVTYDFDKSFICGHYDARSDSSFVLIDNQYADRPGMYLKKQAYDAFILMWQAARKDGIELTIRSATRNFDYQRGIWERKWTGQTILSDGTNASNIADPAERALKILEYSSMPGTSRHHWGTEIDLNSFENRWFESGSGLNTFNWLESNASNFGYCRPYTAKDDNRPFGYNEEKWHWSYFPLAKDYTRFAADSLNNMDINGFLGSEVAQEISVVEKYVLGINHSCKF